MKRKIKNKHYLVNYYKKMISNLLIKLQNQIGSKIILNIYKMTLQYPIIKDMLLLLLNLSISHLLNNQVQKEIIIYPFSTWINSLNNSYQLHKNLIKILNYYLNKNQFVNLNLKIKSQKLNKSKIPLLKKLS